MKYRLKFPQGHQIMDEMSAPGKALGCTKSRKTESRKKGSDNKVQMEEGENPTSLSSFHSCPTGSRNKTTNKETFHSYVHQTTKSLLMASVPHWDTQDEGKHGSGPPAVLPQITRDGPSVLWMEAQHESVPQGERNVCFENQ